MMPCSMDEATLREFFAEHTRGQSKFTRRIAIDMADVIGLPPMSLVWRLEKMGLLKRGSWDWFKANGGITKAHVEEARREKATAQSQESTASGRPHRRPQGSHINGEQP